MKIGYFSFETRVFFYIREGMEQKATKRLCN